MLMICIRHTRKLVLALEEGVFFYLHVVNDIELHSYNNDTVREYNFGSYINKLIISLHFCFRKTKT